MTRLHPKKSVNNQIENVSCQKRIFAIKLTLLQEREGIKFLHFFERSFSQQSQPEANGRTKMALGSPGARAQARGEGSVV